MPKIKMTKREVERLKAPDPSGRQTLYWDEEMRGFGILVSGKTNARSYVVQRDLPDGRTRRVTIGPVNVMELEEARGEATAVLAGMYRGIDPKAARAAGATLRQVLDAYLEARKDLRPGSRDAYRYDAEHYLACWLDTPLRDITPEMVEDRHRAIAAEVAAREELMAARRSGRALLGSVRDRATRAQIREAIRGDDAAAVRREVRAIARAAEVAVPEEPESGRSGEVAANKAMITLRTLWNWQAERVDDFPASPVRRLRRQWYPVARRERHVSADELPTFYRAVRDLANPVASDYILLLLFTGLRRNEAATLTWADIDFRERVIRLPAARTKGGRRLDLPMSDFVHGLLVTRRRAGDAKYVFPANSRSGHIEEPKFAFGQVAAACGITVSSHDLRRTFITVAEATEISPLALKALVNHSVGRDVTAGYVQIGTERLRQAAQRVTDHMFELCGVEQPEGVEKFVVQDAQP